MAAFAKREGEKDNGERKVERRDKHTYAQNPRDTREPKYGGTFENPYCDFGDL